MFFAPNRRDLEYNFKLTAVSRTWRMGTSGVHQNYSIVENVHNTEKSPGDLS